MIGYRIKVEGLDEALKAIQRSPQVAVKEISGAISRSIVKLHSETLKQAPVNKQTGGGNLRQNIRSSLRTRLSGYVESNAPYSIFVHEGTKPHVIRPRNKQALANTRTGQFFGKKVNHPGTSPNPFMKRAFEKTKTFIENQIQTALERITEDLAK